MIQSSECGIDPEPPRKNLHRHLQRALKESWKAYRRNFIRCRTEFSEASVHQLRVESRRLLALLNLLQPLVGEAQIELPRDLVKKQLRRFARLRDTQVQLLHTGEKLRAFPRAKPFQRLLRKRERRLIRRVGARMHRARLGQIRQAMSALRKDVRRVLADQSHEGRHWNTLLRAVNQASARVTELRQRCRQSDVATIHRMRVAFKKFRYMVELLQPVLPDVPKRTLRALHDFQGRMGEIQDAEMMLAALDKFGRKQPQAATVHAFRRDVHRHRDTLVRKFLADTRSLKTFWPSPVARSHHKLAARSPKTS